MFEEIMAIANAIAKAYSPEKGGEKGASIIQWIIKNLDFEVEYVPEVGIIVSPEHSDKVPAVTVVSHFDLIPSFSKKFGKGEGGFFKVGEKNVTGPLDNTITNASVLWALKNDPFFKENEEWKVLFSQEEEVGFFGMAKFLEKYDPEAKSFYVNLDVTNEGWKKWCSVEYDRPHMETFFAMAKKLKEEHIPFVHVTPERVGDDLDAVLHAGGKGFSYCLPTKGVIHSFKNKASIRSIEEYTRLLGKICEAALVCACSKDLTELPWRYRFSSESMAELWEMVIGGATEDDVKKKIEEEAKTASNSHYIQTAWNWDNEHQSSDGDEWEKHERAVWGAEFAMVQALRVLTEEEFYERALEEMGDENEKEIVIAKIKKLLKKTGFFSSDKKILSDLGEMVDSTMSDYYDVISEDLFETIGGRLLKHGAISKQMAEDIAEGIITELEGTASFPKNKKLKEIAAKKVAESFFEILYSELNRSLDDLEKGVTEEEFISISAAFGIM